jgi:hypothetical protein
VKLVPALALAALFVACKEHQPVHDENAPSCDSLQQRYAALLAAAKACGQAGGACEARVDDRLGCACATFATRKKARELESVRGAWERGLCGHSVGCVPTSCPQPQRGECNAQGRCVDVSPADRPAR